MHSVQNLGQIKTFAGGQGGQPSAAIAAGYQEGYCPAQLFLDEFHTENADVKFSLFLYGARLLIEDLDVAMTKIRHNKNYLQTEEGSSLESEVLFSPIYMGQDLDRTQFIVDLKTHCERRFPKFRAGTCYDIGVMLYEVFSSASPQSPSEPEAKKLLTRLAMNVDWYNSLLEVPQCHYGSIGHEYFSCGIRTQSHILYPRLQLLQTILKDLMDMTCKVRKTPSPRPVPQYEAVNERFKDCSINSINDALSRGDPVSVSIDGDKVFGKGVLSTEFGSSSHAVVLIGRSESPGYVYAAENRRGDSGLPLHRLCRAAYERVRNPSGSGKLTKKMGGFFQITKEDLIDALYGSTTAHI